MTNISIQKERILQFIDYIGISKNKFYIKTGISNGVLDKKSGLSMDTIEKIYSKFPEINPEWLLTGKGQMLKNEISSIKLKSKEIYYDLQEIPLYDVEASLGIVSLFNESSKYTPIDTIKIPNMPKCDGAITVVGDSMYPLIKSGDIVFYKTISDYKNSIYFGNMYLISVDVEGDEMLMVKYVHKGMDDEHIKLVSENRYHADKEIHLSSIKALAIIKGNVRFNALI